MIGKGVIFTLVLAIVAVTIGQCGEIDPQPPSANSTTPITTTPTTTTPTTTTPTTTTPTTTTPTTTSPTTTTPTTTIPTTTIPTTTTPAPKTTTPAPKTTTPAPKTTTPAPKTTTPAPTTPAPTTPAPNITTPAPTTTVAPPAPQPETGKWTVQNKTNNITCIIADMAVQLNVTHKDSQNKTYVVVDVPKNANATGDCLQSEQVLNLTWPASANKTNELIVSFKKNDTAKDFSVAFSVTLEILDGENVTELKLQSIKPEFTTPNEMSYRCVKAQKLNLTIEGSNTTVGFLTISNTQFEAFHNKTDHNFSAAKDCEQVGSPDIVPIAVGCALVGLVAIVLIAYLIGRRRSQARGYLSMPKSDSTLDMIPLQNASSWRRCWQ